MDDGRPERLYREPEDKKLAGVCSGLADYFGVDPTIVRLALVVIGFASGFAVVVAYVIAAIVIPTRPETVARVRAPASSLTANPARSNLLLIGLLVAASLMLVGGQWSWWWFEPPVLGALLVGVGLWLLYARGGRPIEEIPAGLATPSDDMTTLVGEPVAAGPQAEVPPPIPPWGPAAPLSPPVPPAPPHGFPVGIAAVSLIVAGFVALLAVFGLWDVDLEEAIGVALLVIGAALIVGAWLGHWRGLLLGLGLACLVVLALCDLIDVPLDGGSGDRDVVVSSLADLERLDITQELLAGELVLDLTDAPLGRSQVPTTLTADVGIGTLNVYLPSDVSVDLDIEVGVGGSKVDGHEENGVDIDRSEVLDGRPGGGRIELDLHVGLGEVEVVHESEVSRG
ncbi:MAG: PspC domain-containing protein [Acidimicrobiales bacterium]